MGDPRVPAAAETLKAIGFEEVHHSPRGSIYLRWPGRRGTLRVSDHRVNGRRKFGVVAACTFGPHVKPQPAHAERLVAYAIGTYMLRSRPDA